MDASSFANIHLDTELQKSSLEGGRTEETAQFLLGMAERYEEKEKAELPSALKQSLKEIQQDPLGIKAIFLQLKPIYEKSKVEEYRTFEPEDTKKDVQQYFDTVSFKDAVQRILGLADDESLTVGGGYTGLPGESGHAVLYRFRKENKAIIIDLFNTGDGVTNHFDSTSQPPDWFQTQASYQLNQSTDLEKVLREMAIPLLFPRLVEMDDIKELKDLFKCTMDSVYQTLNACCANNKIADDRQLVSKSYVGQQSGSCSVRVFTPLLYDLIPEKMTRDRFRVFYKLESIREFYEGIQNNPKSTADDWILITQATKKLMRVIRKKLTAGEAERYREVLEELSKVNAYANYKVKAVKEILVSIEVREKECSKIGTIEYQQSELQKPEASEEKEFASVNLSKRAITEWIHENSNKSKMDCTLFYEKFNQILGMKQYGNFEKKCAIECFVGLLQENNIHIDTSQINSREKLLEFHQETKERVEAFKALLIHSSNRNIPMNEGTLRVAATFSAIIREASQYGLNEIQLPPYTAPGLLEITQDSGGFMQKIEHIKGLKADDYHQFHLAATVDEQQKSYIVMEEELLKNESFLRIYYEVSAKVQIDKNKCLETFIESKASISLFGISVDVRTYADTKNFDDFTQFFQNKSLLGTYIKGGNILRDLCCLDYHFETKHDSVHLYKPGSKPRFNLRFNSPDIYPNGTSDTKLFDRGIKTPLFNLLNRSAITTSQDASNTTASSLLTRIGRTLLRWPNEMLHKNSEYFDILSSHPWDPMELEKSMLLREHVLLKEFIESNGQQDKEVLLATAFSESNLKLISILDYFSRNPSELTNQYSQTLFMMAIFGGSMQDMEELDEKNFALVKNILEYNIKLFVQDGEPRHGIFILELLSTFRESGFSHPLLEGKYAKLLPVVMDACQSHPHLQKRALCTQIIHEITDFNRKINSSEEKPPDNEMLLSLCNIIILNKKQNDLSPARNFRIFANAGTRYFDTIYENYEYLRSNVPVVAGFLVNSLYPDLSGEEKALIAASVTFENFPNISMIINHQNILLNIARGEVGRRDANVLLKKIPEEYITLAFGPQYSHKDFVRALEASKKPAFVLESVRKQGVEYCIIASSPTHEMTFYFQKNNTEKPLVFLQISGQNSNFQKINPSCITDVVIRRLFSDNPNNSIWVDKELNFVVLDENMQTSFHGKLTADTTNNRFYSSYFNIDNNDDEFNITRPEIYKNPTPSHPIKERLVNPETYHDQLKTANVSSHLQQMAGKNLRMYRAEKTDHLTVELTDYLLSFTENGHGELISSINPSLTLNTKERINLPGSITLYDMDGHQHIIIPNLPFIAANKHGYFENYTLDLSLDSYEDLKENSPSEFEKYSRQKTFFQFQLDENLKPMPTTPEEKLFLCYYYMNIKQYHDALALIKSFRKEEVVEASFPILELLHRIITQSPAFNESVLAIKTQALLVAANIKISKKIQWTVSLPEHLIAVAQRDKVRKFYDCFPDDDCQKEIIHYIRNISQSVYPESMRVENEELRILLGLDLAKKVEMNAMLYRFTSKVSVVSQPSDKDAQSALLKLATDLEHSVSDHSLFANAWQKSGKEKFSPQVLDEQYAPEINTVSGMAIFREREFNAFLISEAKELFKSSYRIPEIFNSNYKIQELEKDIRHRIQSNELLAGSQERLVAMCRDIQHKNPSVLLAIESLDLCYITFEDLSIAYLRNDYGHVAFKMGIEINDPVIANIMLMTEMIMKLSVAHDRLVSIQGAIKNYKKEKSDANASALMTALTEQASEYELNPKNRSLLLFEYHDHIRLRQTQIKSIEHVLKEENDNSCVQFIMGGGKTSVFLPLAAMKNADGDMLSVVIVHEALLAVNEKQLDVKTMQFFSSKSQALQFSRDSSAKPDDLFRILNMLKATQKQRGYIVTSRETLQALELKYIELLGLPSDPNNTKCLETLEKILALFREKGKAIIDEVDSVLYIRKEFNFSDGSELPIEKILVADTLLLYRIMKGMPAEKLTHENVHDYTRLLLNRLIEDKDSFVHALLLKFPEANIVGYLSGENVPVDLINTLPDGEKDRLALVKHQITNLLPSTLLQELNLSYGASKLHPERFAAIPYVCNNVPSESSRFSSPYETLNLTIQMHLASPIIPDLFQKMLREFRIRHFNENILLNNSDTEAAKEFRQLTGLDLDTTYREFLRSGNLDYTLTHLAKNPERELDVKYYCLEYEIAPEIIQFQNILKSDTISFVDQLHSSIGISGTVQNHHTYHSRMRLEESLNPDTDGRTLFHLIEKNSKSRMYSKDKIAPVDMEDAIKEMLNDPNTRAVIDIGALFTGITGEEVAACLSELAKDMHQDIRYVLYYNADNQLCALPVNGGEITVLERTDIDYLNAMLKCDPSQRLTFYDQAHTTGSDIAQMPKAHAVCTIGEKTRLRDLVQGVMRMRQFSENQTVEFLVSHGAGPLLNTDSIINFVQQNQNDELLEDHYRATCKKMSASVRNCYMKVMLHTLQQLFPVPPDENSEKHQQAREKAFKCFQNRLVLKSTGPFEQYGQIDTLENIRKVLNDRMRSELAVCQNGLNEFYATLADPSAYNPAATLTSLQNEMQALIDEAIPLCKTEVVSPFSSITEQVEVQAQQQMQLQTEELQQLFGKSPKIKSEEPCQWKNGRLHSPNTIPLKSFHPAFESNVFVTPNYGYLNNPEKSPDPELQFQRGHVYYLFSKVKITGELSCTVLTQKEAASWKALGKTKSSLNTVWLETPGCRNTSHVQESEREAYEKIVDQVQFLHGDVDLILKQPSHPWLGSLAPKEACHLLNQILANPLFREKKHFYDAHQNEILDLFWDVRVKKLLTLTNTYLRPLLVQRDLFQENSSARSAIQDKITILESLNAALIKDTPRKERLEEFEKILTPENIATLSARRYVSKGLLHAGGVFLKSLVLCIPALLDVVSLGAVKWLKGSSITELAHAHFFKVTGREFVDEVTPKTQANNNKGNSRGTSS